MNSHQRKKHTKASIRTYRQKVERDILSINGHAGVFSTWNVLDESCCWADIRFLSSDPKRPSYWGTVMTAWSEISSFSETGGASYIAFLNYDSTTQKLVVDEEMVSECKELYEESLKNYIKACETGVIPRVYLTDNNYYEGSQHFLAIVDSTHITEEIILDVITQFRKHGEKGFVIDSSAVRYTFDELMKLEADRITALGIH